MVSEDHAERMRIGENYRDFRTNGLGLTLRSAAAEWGMSPSELSYIEQGKTITDWSPPGWAEWAKPISALRRVSSNHETNPRDENREPNRS